jgi:hypothetical protein
MNTDVVQALASRAGALTEFSVALLLARTEGLASRALGAGVQLSRSDLAAKSALATITLLHRASPAASRATGRLVGIALFLAGRTVQAAAQVSRSAVAACRARSADGG